MNARKQIKIFRCFSGIRKLIRTIENLLFIFFIFLLGNPKVSTKGHSRLNLKKWKKIFKKIRLDRLRGPWIFFYKIFSLKKNLFSFSKIRSILKIDIQSRPRSCSLGPNYEPLNQSKRSFYLAKKYSNCVHCFSGKRQKKSLKIFTVFFLENGHCFFQKQQFFSAVRMIMMEDKIVLSGNEKRLSKIVLAFS